MDYVLPVAYAVGIWWLSTVALLYRAGLPRRTYPATMAGASAVLLLALFALVATRDDPSTGGAYVAFAAAVAVWGWHELSYLFGYVTGPRPAPCPPECSGRQRFFYGVGACLYHELAIVATAAVIAALCWDAPNRVGLWSFVILWLMRWSAKLNIFLGVRNLHDEYWPEQLQYLKTFVRERSMNELFPLSVLAATAGIALLVLAAVNADADGARRAGATLLATLLTLATLEHWLLMLKLPDDALWRPGLRSRRRGEPVALSDRAGQRL